MTKPGCSQELKKARTRGTRQLFEQGHQKSYGVFVLAGDARALGDGFLTGDAFAAGEGFAIGVDFATGDAVGAGSGFSSGTVADPTNCHCPLRRRNVSTDRNWPLIFLLCPFGSLYFPPLTVVRSVTIAQSLSRTFTVRSEISHASAVSAPDPISLTSISLLPLDPSG